MCADILFKYRPITTEKQLTRLIDSINNNCIFFPDYTKLNDPLESAGYDIKIPGCMGDGARQIADEENTIVKNQRARFRILSLTENCFSPCMWAHYTNEHNGVCIGYWKRESFSCAKKVEYSENQIADSECVVNSPEELEKKVFGSFFYKHSDWSYEREWRIVKMQEDNDFIYSSDELACIIFGEKLDEKIRNIIIETINNDVPKFYTKIGYRSFGINILPYDSKCEVTGETPNFIRTIDDLKKEIENS